MNTLKEYLTEQGIDFSYFEKLKFRVLNQHIEILGETTMMDGSRAIQIECHPTDSNHPSEVRGKTVLIIEDNELIEVDSSYNNQFA